uniref:Uncharacterized protein n=1 Tax=Amphimedon queenslandica TaxID=400682 RepID=A0A1X7UXA6_AMPQE
MKLPDGDYKGPVPIVKKVLKKRSSKDCFKFNLQLKKIDLGSSASESTDKKVTQVQDYLRTGNLRINSTCSSDSKVS